MKYFIDTNIFLRTLLADVKNQYHDCFRFLKAVKKNKIEAFTASVNIAEAVWTLGSYYNLPKDKVIQATQSILNLRGLKIIDDYHHLLALKLYAQQPIKYIDALIASIPDLQNQKMAMVSYDKDFDKLTVIRKEPAEVLKNFIN